MNGEGTRDKGQGMNEIYILHNVLNQEELCILQKDCDHQLKELRRSTEFLEQEEYEKNTRKNVDEELLNRSCAVDMMENLSMESLDRCREDVEYYFHCRLADSSMPSEDANIIRYLLLTKLPRVLKLLIGGPMLFLFNENYIVKPPYTDVRFRWHRDCEEQNVDSTQYPYWSLWCPIDAVTEENGSLTVGSNCKICDYWYDQQNACLRWVNEYTSSAEKVLSLSPSSIVILSCDLVHSSGCNNTGYYRRVLYVQYSPRVVYSMGGPLCYALPTTTFY